MEVVYFELNNWFPGENYPDAEPFLSWLGNDLKIKFNDEKWVKDNKLVVVESIVDMSSNYCITATREWVKDNCPELLTKYTQFIRFEDFEGETPIGEFGCPFLEYKNENIGIHFAVEVEDENGYLYYVLSQG